MTAVGAIKNEFHDLEAKGHALIAQLKEKEHELAGEFRAWFNEWTGRMPAVEAEVKVDAKQIEHDAVEAEKPLAEEVVQDAAAVADTAVSGSTGPTMPAVESKAS